MRLWIAMMGAAAILIGCGIFFVLQNLSQADQYASVLSFFLALATAIGSALSLARSRSTRATKSDRLTDDLRAHHTSNNYAWRNGAVVQGDGSTVDVTINKGFLPEPDNREI
jgi:hypothetical protein